MMKSFLLVFFCVYGVLPANAQYPKLIVQLKDKGGDTYDLNNPSQFLSAKAIERRKRYNIAIDSTDLPLSAKYVDSIKSSGVVTVLSESKWLNQVLIQIIDQKAIDKIMSFSFVKSAKGIGYRPVNAGRVDKFKRLPPPVNLPQANRPVQVEGNTFDYGNNYNQVHIHEGEFLHNKGFRGEKMQITVLDAGFQQYKTVTAFDSVRLNGQILGERDF